jgi:hypothetical protein
MSGRPDSSESHLLRAMRAGWVPGALLTATLFASPLLHAQEPEQQFTPQTTTNSAQGAHVTLHGVVRNAVNGEPLARALVRIEGDNDQAALTDSEGRFEIPGVLTGPEIVRLVKPGFRDRSYATEEASYESDGPAHSVLVTADMPGLDFTLTPDSAIHGHVELSTGDPAEGINITLLKRLVRNGREVWMQNSSTRTNADGAYRFGSLPSGVYAIYTQPSLESEPASTLVVPGALVARNGYPSVFYPDAREFSGAARIRLQAGDQVEASFSLALEPFQTVTAIAVLPNGKQFADGAAGQVGVELVAPVVMDAAEHQLPYTAQYDATTHSVQASLPDGSYQIFVTATAVGPSGPIWVNKTSSRQVKLAGFADVSVAGHSMTNVHVPLSPASSWPVHVRIVRTALAQSARASQNPLTQVSISAVAASGAPVEGSWGEEMAEPVGADLLEMNPDGPGAVWVHTQVNDRSMCLGSFTAAGINLAREPLALSPSGTAPPMELTLRDDCATLHLSLPPGLAAFLPGEEPFYTVYVVPDFDTTDDIPPMTMHASSGPTLSMDGLTPGSYHVYVFTTPVRLEYRNPTAMAALQNPGQQITLSPGATSNLVLEVPER